MSRARNHSSLNVILWGKQAAQGFTFMRGSLEAPCRFHSFPEGPKLRAVPAILRQADVVLASAFPESLVEATLGLKLLHATGAGVDNFCLTALSPRTTVANAYFHGPAIAEYVMMMILALSRDLLGMDERFRHGLWQGSWLWGSPSAAEIHGKTLGLIGFGHIGREVAARACAFGMKLHVISAHPPVRLLRHIDSHHGPDGLRALLRHSDYVVLCCPLNDSTRGLMGKRELGWMKRTACLINVARGPVVQEAALYQALATQRVYGAALDVWYQYPKDERPCMPSQFPFHKLDNIIMTPHVSGWMKGTQENRFKFIAANLNRLAAGEPLENVIQGPRRHRPLGSPRVQAVSRH